MGSRIETDITEPFVVIVRSTFSYSSRQGYVRTQVLSECVRCLRRIQLRAFYFNNLCSSLAYSMKLICLCVCIVGIFFCIKISRIHPLTGIVSGCVGAMMWCCYTVVYNRGFELPWMVQMIQVELLLRSGMLPSRRRMILVRQVKSLGRVEVSMGGFHALERSSTIIFLDFALARISSLIITFPGQL